MSAASTLRVKVDFSFPIELFIWLSKKTELSGFEGVPYFLIQDGASLAGVDEFTLFSPYKVESSSS